MSDAGFMTEDGVGWAIRHLRDREGISARALSLAAGLSPSYVGKIEKGEISPSFEAFARIALVLKMSLLEVAYCVLSAGSEVTITAIDNQTVVCMPTESKV